MTQMLLVFKFGWKYLHRYWVRLALGVTFAAVFGSTNASFLWATKTLTERLVPPGIEEKADPKHSQPPFSQALSIAKTTPKTPKEPSALDSRIDAWLPRANRALDWRQILGGILLLPMLGLVRSAANYISTYCIAWASERMIRDMRLDVLHKLTSLSMDFFVRHNTGDLLTRINADTSSLLRSLKVGAADLVKESISLVGILGMLLYLNWKLTLFALGFIPFCLFPLMVLARKVRRAAKAARSGEVLLTAQMVEVLSGIRIIKAFNLEQAQMDRYRSVSRDLVSKSMKGVRAKELTNPVIELVSMLGLGVMIVLVFHLKMNLSEFATFLAGAIYFFVPIKKLANVHVLFEQTAPGVDRLIQLLTTQPSVREIENPKPLPRFEQGIRLNNVSFAYLTDPVLKNVTIDIPKGYKIGIAGPSGSGKSTIVNLLFRFYDPVSGTVTLDGTNLAEARIHDLRQLLAMVSQDVVLFDQTVAENIACGKPGATRTDVETAAKSAFAHDFIMRLPNGYDSRIGERGITLSGGQRQRLAIARAFVRNAPILVLDEATSSLDSEAEAEVQQAIDLLSANRTVISVAHRLSTLANCDRIVVLANGVIVESGSFKELLAKGGYFSEMARRQGLVGQAKP